MDLYYDQTLLSIQLATSYDLAGATDVKIEYRKPDETTGHWVGVIEGGTIKRELADGDVDMPGVWKIQGSFMKGGKKGKTQIVYLTFKKL